MPAAGAASRGVQQMANHDRALMHFLSCVFSTAGVSPAWELFFQAMCCPVPQELKAALDGAIAAAACRADVAAALWERLLAAVVVAPIAEPGLAVPRYDLSYQLNEIEVRCVFVWDEAYAWPLCSGEGAHATAGSRSTPCHLPPMPHLLQARAEDYSEALAFVRLLNALWRSGGGAALADGGRSTAHLTKFVREDLLGTLFQVPLSWGRGGGG